MTAKKRYHHGDLRRAIISKAVSRARRNGEKAIVLREIAAEIDVSATAAYRHFTSRDDLVVAVAAEGFRRVRNSMATERVTDGGEVPVGDRLGLAAYAEVRNSVLGLLEFSFTERPWSRLMLDTWSSQAAGGRGEFANHGYALADALYPPLRRGAQAGFFRPDIDLVADRKVWMGIFSLSAAFVYEVFPSGSFEAMLDELGNETADATIAHLLTDRGREVVEAAGGGPSSRIRDLREWAPLPV